MRDEPLHPIQHRERVYPDSWYCLHCKERRTSRSSVEWHVQHAHFAGNTSLKPEEGVDWADTDGIVVIFDTWNEWAEEIIRRFHLRVESLIGADDLAFEVRDGAGVPPYA